MLADTTAPTLLSIAAIDPLANNFGVVHYIVTFSEPVTGVDASDFTLSADGLTGASIASVDLVSGSNGTQYEISINDGSGDGTVTLNMIGVSIYDTVGNPLWR